MIELPIIILQLKPTARIDKNAIIPKGKGHLKLSTNYTFKCEYEAENILKITIINNLQLIVNNSNKKLILVFEQGFLIKNLKNDRPSIDTIEQSVYITHGNLLVFIKKHLPEFYDLVLIQDTDTLSSDMQEFLNIIFSDL